MRCSALAFALSMLTDVGRAGAPPWSLVHARTAPACARGACVHVRGTDGAPNNLYIVMAHIAMAYIVMAHIAMAYIVMAHIAMAYPVNIVMVYIVMAYFGYGL